MSEQPDLSTLSQRMRYAAVTLGEAKKYYANHNAWDAESWDADLLIKFAEYWEESEKRAAADREAMVEELARALCAAFHHASGLDDRHLYDYYKRAARTLMESGWRKGDPE